MKKETKYFKVSFDTNVEGFAKHSMFYTKSDYYNREEIEVQVKNNISNLRLPTVARVKDISVIEISAAESSILSPIESAYRPLKQMANNMRWNMERERLERSGVKHIKLMLFLEKVDDFLTSSDDE